MKLSRAVDYAILGLTSLSRKNQGRSTVTEISQTEGLSLYFLRKVFQKLEHARLIKGQRGIGYQLRKKPQHISLRHIVEAVEGPIALQACMGTKNSCTRQHQCSLISVWKRIQDRLLDDLDSVCLTDFLHETPPSSHQ